MCTPMFIAALFIIARTWKPSIKDTGNKNNTQKSTVFLDARKEEVENEI